MKIGLFTDSLGDRSLEDALDQAAELGVETVELATGNWSTAPHLRLSEVVDNCAAQRALLDSIEGRGLRLEALNANGNPLHPTDGSRQAGVLHDTIRLAGQLGVSTVVAMSGLPAAPGDRHPNWITTAWPPECGDILEYQWNDVALPFWRATIARAAANGVGRVALELHPHQLVYNVSSFRRLHDQVGDIVGVNLDPSHLMWMGADPLDVVAALGVSIYHVHAKDTRIEGRSTIDTNYETRPFNAVSMRAWNYVTLGRGHPDGVAFWRRFIGALDLAGYIGALSIEHEDAALPRLEGVTASVDVLKEALQHQ